MWYIMHHGNQDRILKRKKKSKFVTILNWIKAKKLMTEKKLDTHFEEINEQSITKW